MNGEGKVINIGIDGRVFQSSRTGVGRYSYELCLQLNRLFPSAIFYVYSSRFIKLPVDSERWILRLDNLWISKFIKPVLWLKYRCGLLCQKDNLDIFWGSATFLPKLNTSVKKIITVYDLTYKISPKTMSLSHRIAFCLYFKKDAQAADAVVSISKGTADRLFNFFGIRSAAIVYPAVDNIFKKISKNEILRSNSKYRLRDPYFLAVATWEPRKNLELLIRAFLELKNEGFLKYHTLVLAGGRGWKDSRLFKILKKNPSIISLGYVPDSSLVSLYNGAACFIFPSIYEGFGMPVAEARACGTKVITCNTPELKEAGDLATIYVTPSLSGIKNGILKATSTRSKLPNLHIRKTWNSGGEVMVGIMKKLLS